jgi:hypothetical protein
MTATLTWRRYGAWSAHLFVETPAGPEQVCSTQHGQFPGFNPAKGGAPVACELGPHGIPFGKVCAHCLKRFRMVREKKETRS